MRPLTFLLCFSLLASAYAQTQGSTPPADSQEQVPVTLTVQPPSNPFTQPPAVEPTPSSPMANAVSNAAAQTSAQSSASAAAAASQPRVVTAQPTSAQSNAAAEQEGFILEPLPNDPRFNAPITVRTSLEGTPLREFVAAVSRSIGLVPIVNEVPDTLIYDYEFEQTPFRQVFRIVLGLNGLDYILDANNVVILGSIEAIANYKAREPRPEPVEPVEVITPPAVNPIPTEQRFFRVSGNPEGFAAAIRAAVPNAEVAIIPGINSLSVVATVADLQRTRAILDELDPPPVQEGVIPTYRRVYKLANAKADELAEILRGIKVDNTEEEDNTNVSTTTIALNTGAADPFTETTSSGGGGVAQQEFTITPDPRTNSLIINATEAQHEQFAEIIPQLDVAQPQINVQIRIQEITRTAAQNLGVDLNAGFGNFATTLLDTGLNFVFDAQRAVSGLNIGAVLDTLERQGLSRRVDDTTLTILNNGQAQMQAGGTIEINVPPDIVRTIPYGVQISVSPQITGTDGEIVNLTISAKVSDILSDIGDPNFIQFSDRNVSSTLSLAPGQTVLLGGLFQNSLTESERGVPLLSDLPVVGQAFKRTSSEETDTELLLIVTADIVDGFVPAPDLSQVMMNLAQRVQGERE